MKAYFTKFLLFILLLLTQFCHAQIIKTLIPSGGDDKAQLQAALDAGGGNPITVTLQRRSGVAVDSFRISNTVYYNFNNITFNADTNQVKIVPYGGSSATAFDMFKTKIVKTASGIGVSIHKDSLKSYIVYPNASFLAGKILQTIGKHKWQPFGSGYWYYRGLMSYVSRKSGDTSFITVNPLETNNDTAYNVYTPISNLRVNGIWVDLSHVNTDGWNGFQMYYVYRASFHGMKFTGNPNITTGMVQAIHLVGDSADIQYCGFYNIRPNTTATSRYTINYEGSNMLIHHNTLINCGDAIENGGSQTRTIHCKIYHNDVETSKAYNGQIGTHLNAFDIDESYNIIKGTTDHSLLHVAGQNSRMSHNFISVVRPNNSSTDRSTWEEYGSREHNTIDSNVYVFTSPAGTSIGLNNAIQFSNITKYAYFNDATNTRYGIDSFYAPINDTKIRGNKFYGCRIQFSTPNGYVNTQVTNNTFYTWTGVTPTLPTAATGLTLTGSVVITSNVPAPPSDPATISFNLCPIENGIVTPPPPPPVQANAGADWTYYKNQTRPDTLFLNASASTGATSYLWTLISGPTTPTVINQTTAQARTSGALTAPGLYRFQLSINSGAAKDTIAIFVRDWQKKNLTPCRSGYDTTAKTGGHNFIINPTETKSGGLSSGWNLPYLNRDNYISTHGYAGETIQGGDSLSFPGADTVHLFNIGDVGGNDGCPVYLIPKTKPLVFRGAKVVVGQDQLLDSNVVNHVVMDGLALRGSGYAFGFQTNNETPYRSPVYNSFGGGWVTDFTYRGFYNQHVATAQIKLDGDSLIAYKQFDKFVQNNITLSDFLIDSSSGEALYIGNTDPDGTKSYNGYHAPQRMNHVVVKNGVVLNTQYDGIQFSNTRNNCLAQNNLVFNSGTLNTANQRTGIEMGGNTQGTLLRNIVLRSTGAALDNYGYGDHFDTQNIIDSVFDNALDLNGSAGLYQRSIYSPTDYEATDSAMKAVTNGNLFARVYKSSRYIKTANNTGDRVQRIGAITNNIFVNDSVTLVTSLIENNTGATLSGNTIKTVFPIQWMGYSITSTGYQFTILQGDSARTFTAVDDAVAWLLYRASLSSVPNTPPTANAGATQVIASTATTLAGIGGDKEGPVFYQWTRDSGPDTVTIQNPTAAITNVYGLVQGTYVFRLTVKDNSNATVFDTVSVVVSAISPPSNQPPTAEAGSDQVITFPIDSVNVIGTGTDLDGTIQSYTWSQKSGPNTATIKAGANGAVTFKFTTTGTWKFMLTVVDNSGALGIDSMQVQVLPSTTNTAPTISIISPKTGAMYATGSSITITASVSDPDQDVTKVEFYKDGVLLGSVPSSPYSYTWLNIPSGLYNITAIAYDAFGHTTTSAGITLNVGTAPSVRITAPLSGAHASSPVTITATASDADGTITKVLFYSGTTLLNTDTTAPYSYSWSTTTGNKTIMAKAYDNSGRVTNSAQVSFKVR